MAAGASGVFEAGLEEHLRKRNHPTTIVRQGSAFAVYFMDHAPVNWRDVVMNNDTWSAISPIAVR